MLIKGKKVLLRAIELSDAEVLQQMINDEEIEKMMLGYSFPVARHQQIKWIENLSNERNVFRAIIDVNGVAIGTGLRLENLEYYKDGAINLSRERDKRK